MDEGQRRRGQWRMVDEDEVEYAEVEENGEVDLTHQLEKAEDRRCLRREWMALRRCCCQQFH